MYLCSLLCVRHLINIYIRCLKKSLIQRSEEIQYSTIVLVITPLTRSGHSVSLFIYFERNDK